MQVWNNNCKSKYWNKYLKLLSVDLLSIKELLSGNHGHLKHHTSVWNKLQIMAFDGAALADLTDQLKLEIKLW